MRFRVNFPDGWATANQTAAVVGIAPQKDAAMQLTLAAAPNAEEAARGFAAQQNLQVAREGFQSASVSGLRALSGRFRAASQQGTVDGTVVFVEHEKRVFQLVGFAPSQAYSTHARALENALFSFERETDPAVLNDKPWRLDIVTPNRELSIDDFARWYPGPVDAETLARINGKDPGERLPRWRACQNAWSAKRAPGTGN